MKKDEFRNFVKSIILEVKKEKKKDSDTEKKDKKVSYLDASEKVKYRRDVDGDYKQTGEKLVDQVKRIVKKIDKKADAVLDDHNDVTAILPGVFKIRIAPKGAGLFDVEAYRNMADRIYAIALTKDQVLDFVKVNFSEKKKGYVQTAYDKSMDNLKDSSEKKAKELPKTEPVKYKEVPDKDIEDDVEDENDNPDAPMAEVDEKDIKRQEEYDVQKNKTMPKIQKMIKKEVDDDLTKSWKK